MGNCNEPPMSEDHRRIDQAMKSEQTKDKQVKKLLFLGAGGSGKSTLFKQLKIIGAGGMMDHELDGYKYQVSSNIIKGLKAMVDAVAEETSPLCEKLQYVNGLEEDFVINSKTDLKKLRECWNSDEIQAKWATRGDIQVQDNLKYFMDNLDRIAKANYSPSVEDVLNVRVRTTGITEIAVSLNGSKFIVIDVGGQRNERRKWMHSFAGVTAVIFVASLSAFDQCLYEDESVNRMQEALQLFENIVNSNWFIKTDVILFLNKYDLFVEKLANKRSIRTAFPEYTGEDTSRDSLKYIKAKFRKKNRRKGRKIFMHTTTAIDTNLTRKIFDDVQHMIISNSLKSAGLTR